ncbi:HAMP domain-containing histidine kinase [Nocardioides sp. GY 10113]|uniref:sensor histidine kinase n=1 Tax=Nocardioides sp. GY 10113 TaxID=2569761 RepID=UPI0010A78C8A|nr:HAMP domain-containing sensor histidine kinase [Nocardioides sp. GY 10113]TIC80437.1 HAMP domain-containing histidine kinase [Nocardioides sp. GY 10113]
MQRRISWLVVAATATVVVAFVIPLCLLVRTLAEDRAMAAADQEARNVAILVSGLDDDPQLARLVADIDNRGVPTTGVLTSDGRQLGAAGVDLAGDPEVRRARDGEAFTVVDDDGGRVLLPVILDSGTQVVRSSVAESDLHRGVAQAWAGIIGLCALLLAGAAAVAWQLGRRISEPLREVAATAHRLRGGDLAARASLSGTDETRELARALNGLADRTVELLAVERAAAGDLSHRLRTPVTALRLDAEAVDDAELAQRLQDHVAVLQRTIDAIVREARRPVRTDLAPTSGATGIVRARMEFWRPLAEDQHRALTVLLPDEELWVPLAEEDLRDLVDVLVDNVFAHTPEGTALRVGLHVEGGAEQGRAVLTVSDSGPGLAARRPGDREGSTGLGLDIAARTAGGCGGDLTIGTGDEGGALVVVRLPLVRG